MNQSTDREMHWRTTRMISVGIGSSEHDVEVSASGSGKVELLQRIDALRWIAKGQRKYIDGAEIGR